jgi:hypothetical protein
MTVKIRETGEIIELGIIDPKTECNYVKDFVGNTGAFDREFAEYDDDTGCYVADEADVKWWQNVIAVHEHVGYVIDAIDDSISGEESATIQQIVEDAMSGDLDYFATPEEFDAWFADELADYGYTMTLYSDGSIGFGKK